MIQISELQPGDLVQARSWSSDGAGQVLVTEFTVTSVSGISVFGSDHFPDGMGTDSWTFELIGREQTYPTSLGLIDAHLGDGSVARLMGMGEVWTRVDDGSRVPTNQIIYFDLVIT